jgi:hypothetical protein
MPFDSYGRKSFASRADIAREDFGGFLLEVGLHSAGNCRKRLLIREAIDDIVLKYFSVLLGAGFGMKPAKGGLQFRLSCRANDTREAILDHEIRSPHRGRRHGCDSRSVKRLGAGR